jgi:hypothetical protein
MIVQADGGRYAFDAEPEAPTTRMRTGTIVVWWGWTR